MQASRHKDLTPSVREGVDTLLMYLYRALNHVDDMERLASSENSCIVVFMLRTIWLLCAFVIVHYDEWNLNSICEGI